MKAQNTIFASDGGQISDDSELCEARRFFRLVFAFVLFWSILWSIMIGIVILRSLLASPHGPELETSLRVMLYPISTSDSLIMSAVLIGLCLQTRNSAKLISHPDWRKTASSANKSLWVGLVSLLCGWPVIIVSVHVWLFRLTQLCGTVGAIRRSQIVQQRAKQACRNWCVLAFQAAGFIVIGIVLVIQSSNAPFFQIFSVPLLIFLVYCFICSLTVIRLTIRALAEAEE